MDKRTLLALILMLAVFMIFDQFIWKPQKAQQAAAKAEETAEPVKQATMPSTESSNDSLKINPNSAFIAAEINSDLMLKNDKVQISFSNLGARITQVELLEYRQMDKSNATLIPQNESLAGTKLIHAGFETNLDQEVFHYTQPDDRKLVFYLTNGSDSLIVKSFSLNDDYGVDLDIKVTNFTPFTGIALSFESGIADTEKNLKTKAQDYKFLLYANNELKKLDMKKLKKTAGGEINTFTWAAIRSKYFTLAVMEKEPPLTRNFFASNNEKTDSPAFYIDSVQKQAKSTWEQSYTLYLGPADFKLLKTYGRGMENIAELGARWLRWLSALFAWFLNFLHGYIRNYGVVIILFALVIKVVLHPVSHKQLDSSLKMQRIQPQVQEIQQKYKGDPKRMQQELSLLYKEAGTSPLAGCLPLLLQMPVFISLYSVLRYSLDMRNAHFVGWLKDLSEPDPYLVLPVLMGVFMILQSLLMQPPKQNIDQMDDKQKAAAQSAKMMTWIMPIFMFFIFKGMPAGLVLYWTVFNVFTVIQQYYLQKHFKQKDS